MGLHSLWLAVEMVPLTLFEAMAIRLPLPSFLFFIGRFCCHTSAIVAEKAQENDSRPFNFFLFSFFSGLKIFEETKERCFRQIARGAN